jgi:hypothetical protein
MKKHLKKYHTKISVIESLYHKKNDRLIVFFLMNLT